MYGLDIVGANAKLAPKLTNMSIYRAVAAFKIVIPYTVQKLLPGKCQLAVHHQIV